MTTPPSPYPNGLEAVSRWAKNAAKKTGKEKRPAVADGAFALVAYCAAPRPELGAAAGNLPGHPRGP